MPSTWNTVAIRSCGPIGVALRHVGLGGRLADDLAHLQSAAGEGQRAERRPVVAAGVVVDARRAAELAGDDEQNLLARGRARRTSSTNAETA